MRRMETWAKSFAAVLMLLLAVTGTSFAQEEKAGKKAGEEISAGKVSSIATEIANEIYSPFCPGKTLAMCPSPRAADVRRDIEDLAREGMEKEQIKETIVAEYGEKFRLTEPPLTDNIGLFGVLGAGFLLAALAVVLMSRRRKDGKEQDEAPSDEVSDEESEDDSYISELRGEYRD